MESDMPGNRPIAIHQHNWEIFILVIDVPINAIFQTSLSSKISCACTIEDKYCVAIK